MRNIFVGELMRHAESDPNLIVLTADLGYNAFEKFRDRFPKQFYNVGIAEANMVGVAAGLAMSGKKVCIYSIVPFVTFRVLEQIRNYVCDGNLDIKIIAVGGGFSYGTQGISHSSIEDLAVMRSLPNMTVLFPGEASEARELSREALLSKGPVYLRLGKGGESIHDPDIRIPIGKGIVIREGRDIALLSIGNIMGTVFKTAELLEADGVSVKVISFPTLKPFDVDLIRETADEVKGIFTIEEHSLIGGLGTTVAEIIAEENLPVLFKRFALPDEYGKELGSQDYLRRFYGLDEKILSEKIVSYLKNI
jgi:transketolase